jgi:hypothetical protein
VFPFKLLSIQFIYLYATSFSCNYPFKLTYTSINTHTAKFFQSPSNNLETRKIQHFRRAVPRMELLLFSEKSFISETSRSQQRGQKCLQEFLYITIVVYPDPLSPTPSTASAMKTPENPEDPDGPEPEVKTDIQTEHSSDYLCSPSVQAVRKSYQ